MHALVAAVLLRVTGLDALDGDAKLEPPDRELGEIEEGIGAGEGDAVVGSDGFGQSALGKGLIVAATRSGPLTQQRPGVHRNRGRLTHSLPNSAKSGLGVLCAEFDCSRIPLLRFSQISRSHHMH